MCNIKRKFVFEKKNHFVRNKITQNKQAVISSGRTNETCFAGWKTCILLIFSPPFVHSFNEIGENSILLFVSLDSCTIEHQGGKRELTTWHEDGFRFVLNEVTESGEMCVGTHNTRKIKWINKFYKEIKKHKCKFSKIIETANLHVLFYFYFFSFRIAQTSASSVWLFYFFFFSFNQ